MGMGGWERSPSLPPPPYELRGPVGALLRSLPLLLLLLLLPERLCLLPSSSSSSLHLPSMLVLGRCDGEVIPENTRRCDDDDVVIGEEGKMRGGARETVVVMVVVAECAARCCAELSWECECERRRRTDCGGRGCAHSRARPCLMDHHDHSQGALPPSASPPPPPGLGGARDGRSKKGMLIVGSDTGHTFPLGLLRHA
jgi:hypothetical protein